jgi:hypothetical protein
VTNLPSSAHWVHLSRPEIPGNCYTEFTLSNDGRPVILIIYPYLRRPFEAIRRDGYHQSSGLNISQTKSRITPFIGARILQPSHSFGHLKDHRKHSLSLCSPLPIPSAEFFHATMNSRFLATPHTTAVCHSKNITIPYSPCFYRLSDAPSGQFL